MSNIELEVVGHRVMLRPEYQEEKTEWGFEMNTGDTFKRELGATQVGTIVGIGPTAWKDFVDYDKHGNKVAGRPWAKLGDKIYYAKYSGKTVKAGEAGNEEDYVIINDEDCQCVIKEVKK